MGDLSVADVLRRAADLIEPEGAWTQGEYARDMFGGRVGDGRAADAVCWCAIGAMEKASGHLIGGKWAEPLCEIIGGNGRIDQWNDDPARTQAEVVAKLREAADLAEKDAAHARV